MNEIYSNTGHGITQEDLNRLLRHIHETPLVARHRQIIAPDSPEVRSVAWPSAAGYLVVRNISGHGISSMFRTVGAVAVIYWPEGPTHADIYAPNGQHLQRVDRP